MGGAAERWEGQQKDGRGHQRGGASREGKGEGDTTHVFVLVPAQGVSSEYKPRVLAASLDEGHGHAKPSLPDHLIGDTLVDLLLLGPTGSTTVGK